MNLNNFNYFKSLYAVTMALVYMYTKKYILQIIEAHYDGTSFTISAIHIKSESQLLLLLWIREYAFHTIIVLNFTIIGSSYAPIPKIYINIFHLAIWRARHRSYICYIHIIINTRSYIKYQFIYNTTYRS